MLLEYWTYNKLIQAEDQMKAFSLAFGLKFLINNTLELRYFRAHTTLIINSHLFESVFAFYLVN